MIRPNAQLAITTLPIRPTAGSAQTHPEYIATASAPIASNEGRGIRHDVDIGGAEIVVVMTMVVMVMIVVFIMRMAVVMAVMVMIVAAAQQPRAGEVDAKTERRHRDRLAIDDRHRREEPQHALIGDLDRDQPEDDRAGEGGEIAELAGAEGEMRIAQVPAREAVGERGNAERGCVRAHVPAVGEQRHRAEQRAGDDLADHHDQRQDHHEPGAPLVLVVLLAQESVVMGPLLDGMGMHRLNSPENRIRKGPI
ncbi:hypothetical protein BRDID11002_65960 [Bradyrhizobium diazoefficiens]